VEKIREWWKRRQVEKQQRELRQRIDEQWCCISQEPESVVEEIANREWLSFHTYRMPDAFGVREEHGIKTLVPLYHYGGREMSRWEKSVALDFYDPHYRKLPDDGICGCGLAFSQIKEHLHPCGNAPWRSDPQMLYVIMSTPEPESQFTEEAPSDLLVAFTPNPFYRGGK
jgi:hypothetical protein